MSVQNYWLLRVRAYQKILCQAFHAIPRETGAYFDILLTLLYRSIYALFVDFVLVSTFHYKTTKKRLVCFLSKRKWQLNLEIKRIGWMRTVKLKGSVRHQVNLQNFKSQRPQTQRVLWENSVWRGKMYTLGYSMTKKKTCHAQFVWSTKRTMHLPRERITFDLLRLNGTWLTTGRQPCEFEAAWRQLFDTPVELLHCLQFGTVDLGKTKVIPRNVS